MRLALPVAFLFLFQTQINVDQIRNLILGGGTVTSDDGQMVVQVVSPTELVFCPRCTAATPGLFRFNQLVGEVRTPWSCRVTEVTDSGSIIAYFSLAYVDSPSLLVSYSGPATMECDGPFVQVTEERGEYGFIDFAIPIAACVGSGVEQGFGACRNYGARAVVW